MSYSKSINILITREQRGSHLQTLFNNNKSSHKIGTSHVFVARDILDILRNRSEIQDNMITVMATCPEKLLQHLIDKKSLNCIDNSYLLALKKFAITLHFYSPETYSSIQTNFGLCLPKPSVIWMWYQQLLGWPGITQRSIEIMALPNKTRDMVLGCLLVYEVKLREDIKCRPPRHETDTADATYYGYADIGNHLHGNHIDIANEALIITAVTIPFGIKIPLGNFYGKNFKPLQKANLIKLCIDSLSESKVRIISVTLNGTIYSSNLARALGANIDTAPFKPYFTHNDTKYYLIIDPIHVTKLVKQLFVQEPCLYHNDNRIMYLFVQLLYSHRNELQIDCRRFTNLWNNCVTTGIKSMERKGMSPVLLGHCRATVTFIANITKMLRMYDIKRKISQNNYKNFQTQIEAVYEYIQSLKDSNDDLMDNPSYNFVFNIMLSNFLVLQFLYTDYIEPRKLKFLPTSKLLLKNFPSFIMRANFTAEGLSSIYKHLVKKALNHSEISQVALLRANAIRSLDSCNLHEM